MLNKKYAKVFINSTQRNIVRVEEIFNKTGFYEEDDLGMFIINLCAIRVALEDVGEWELAAAAAKLAQGGKDKSITMMLTETPVFLTGLRSVVEKLNRVIEAG